MDNAIGYQGARGKTRSPTSSGIEMGYMGLSPGRCSRQSDSANATPHAHSHADGVQEVADQARTASFIRLYESEFERPRTEWFLTFGNQKTGTVCFAYDVHLSKWHTLPLGFLPFELTNRSPLAAADGLICLGAGWNRGNMPSKLVICNPVSRSGSCSFLCINLYTNCSTVASSVVVCGWSIYRRSFLAPCAF